MPALNTIHLHLVELAAAVSVNPEQGRLPGLESFQKLLNGAARLAILACVAAFVIGAGQWAFGNRAHNYSQSADGRERMLKALAGAFAIGAVAAFVNFFYDAGAAVR
jgi:Family of unknown function (DUF6112)